MTSVVHRTSETPSALVTASVRCNCLLYIAFIFPTSRISRHQWEFRRGCPGCPHSGFTMSFLQNTTLLQSTRAHSILDSKPSNHVFLEKHTDGSKTLRSRGSIAALVNLVRNPVATVGEAVENWYDGLTAEERTRKQQLEDTTHILYLRLRCVRVLLIVSLPYRGLI